MAVREIALSAPARRVTAEALRRMDPEEIGRAVTRAVVLSFMFIFVLNYVITRILM